MYYIVVYYVSYVDEDYHPNRRRECCVFGSLDRATEFIENHLADTDMDDFCIYEAKKVEYTTHITVTVNK